MVVDSIEDESLKFAATRYIDAITGIVGLIVYTNVLTATSVGLYFTGVAVFSIASSAATGLYAAVKKKGSEDDTNLSKYFSLAVAGSSLYGLIGSLLMILGYLVVTSGSLIVQYEVPIILLYGIVIRFVPECLYRSVVTVYDSRGKVALSGYYDLLRGIIQTLLQVVLIIVTANFLYLFVASAISTVIIGSLMYLKLEDVRIKTFSMEEVSQIKSFGVWNSVDALSKRVEPRITTIIISAILSPAIAGVYGVVLRTTRPALYISRSLSRTLFVETSHRKSKDESIEDEVSLGLKYAPIIAVPMFFGTVGLSENILSFLYTPEYTKGALVLIGMSLATIMKSESKILGAYIYGCNRPKTVTKSALISLIVSLPILTLGLGRVGFDILVVSLILSRLFEMAYLYKESSDIGSLNVDKSILYQFISSSVMLLFILIQKELFEIESYIVLISVASSGLLYFITMSVVDKDFRKKSTNFVEQKIYD